MQDLQNAFLNPVFLRSVWANDYEVFKDSSEERALHERLRRWAGRADLKETSAEAAFIAEFFHATWGYVQSGQAGSERGFTLWPKFPIQGAGAKGGTGGADLAIGFFGEGPAEVPQVVCEFKDIRSSLDADQRRKGNTRSPVRQALDYLGHARRGMVGSEPQVPSWAIVTDMNEFRLYWYDRPQQPVRFVIEPRDLFQGAGLLADTEAARFDRYVFARLLHRDTLLTRTGRSALLDLIAQRRFRDRALEEEFYREYRALRARLYTELLARNGEGTSRFPGTRGRLVRLAQKILDRLLFVFFCEDMGQALAFEPKLLRNLLVERSKLTHFDPDGLSVWQDMLSLFRAMNDGTDFSGKHVNQFNGGLFAPDPELEALHVPNSVFYQPGQGQSEDTLALYKETVLYLCATYNYAADLGAGREEGRTLGLYTLGRIFEQSITELEILEAEAEGRASVNKESQRKRDGVYYTPEWVVERVVGDTLGPCLADIRRACDWPAEGEDLPGIEVVDAYLGRLRTFTVLDPACGSGAFLISALRYLLAEWRRTRDQRRQLVGATQGEDDEAALIRDILRDNLYGVDINPASVEITQLALWLHTARADQPLSSLDRTILPGNSLVGPEFYKGQADLAFYDETQKERVNAFDWQERFPEVFARGGFDAVVGNPPYVKLQNFRPAHPDVADYLVRGRPGAVAPPYQSTRTGNFDLYLPFIERGLALLRPEGRLGYIAPSLWTVNEYGVGLRGRVAAGRHLDRWLDFKSFQVFKEATTYTALQFFAKAGTPAIRVAQASSDTLPPDPWADVGGALPWGREGFGNRWLLLTGEERALVDRLAATCRRLDDPTVTTGIFVGIQTSADAVYHLNRLGPGRYLCRPGGTPRPDPYEVETEDAIMRPLISGPEAKRYEAPATQTYLLFPYTVEGGKGRLLRPEELQSSYPKAWAYLTSKKDLLERREAKQGRDGQWTGPVCDEHWYRYVYPKNLDKQDAPKLIVAQTVPSLRVCFDEHGEFAVNNVRVNGILASDGEDPWLLLGILNARVADFVFRRIAKPKDGRYFEANKQFIAPLPTRPPTRRSARPLPRARGRCKGCTRNAANCSPPSRAASTRFHGASARRPGCSPASSPSATGSRRRPRTSTPPGGAPGRRRDSPPTSPHDTRRSAPVSGPAPPSALPCTKASCSSSPTACPCWTGCSWTRPRAPSCSPSGASSPRPSRSRKRKEPAPRRSATRCAPSPRPRTPRSRRRL